MRPKAMLGLRNWSLSCSTNAPEIPRVFFAHPKKVVGLVISEPSTVERTKERKKKRNKKNKQTN